MTGWMLFLLAISVAIIFYCGGRIFFNTIRRRSKWERDREFNG